MPRSVPMPGHADEPEAHGLDLVDRLFQLKTSRGISASTAKAVEIAANLLFTLPTGELPSVREKELRQRYVHLPDGMLQEYYQSVADLLRPTGLLVSLVGMDNYRYRVGERRPTVYAYVVEKDFLEALCHYDGNVEGKIIKTY